LTFHVFSQNNAYSIRMAQSDDGSTIARHRAAMFTENSLLQERESGEIEAASVAWLDRLISTGWLVEFNARTVAGGGILLREQGPLPGCPRVGKWAHVLNVYTERHHRRQGLARRLMQTILGWCQVNNVDHVTLSASHQGRPLYESMGFRPTRVMKLEGSAGIRVQPSVAD
jgi:GNAT superfamily N-acetyltransferase